MRRGSGSVAKNGRSEALYISRRRLTIAAASTTTTAGDAFTMSCVAASMAAPA